MIKFIHSSHVECHGIFDKIQSKINVSIIFVHANLNFYSILSIKKICKGNGNMLTQ